MPPRRAWSCLRCRITTRSTGSTRRSPRAPCTAYAWWRPPRSRRSTAPFEDLHVLGYGIDHRSALLGERLLEARGDRERRADAMAERLEKLGFEVDPEPIRARKAAGKPVGRPHLAAAVLAHPANAERLAEEGHADVSSFIPAYLIQGKPGYVARTHPPWRRRSAGSTTPPASRSGRIRSGTSRRQTRCWRRSTATAPPAWTGWRSSIPRTRRSRRASLPSAARSWEC